MSDTERFLHDALRRLAEQIQPDPELPGTTFRRTRRRQIFLALTLAGTVAASGVTGFAVVGAVRAHRGSAPASPASPSPLSQPPTSLPPTAPVPSCRPGWTVAAQPAPPYVDQLAAISGTAWNDLWAVGARFPEEHGDSIPLIEHWDGRAWSVVGGADAAMGREARLTAVAAISRDDVWVVGDALARGNDILEHWDGQTWSVVPFPSPPKLSRLDRIVAVSADDVWILGHALPSEGGSSFSQDVLLHWDGRSWSLVQAPDPVNPLWGTSAIQSISAAGSGAVWGVGGIVQGFSEAGHPVGALVEFWNGSTWRIVTAPDDNVSLSVVAASPDGDVWAARGSHVTTAGTYGVGPDLIYHWDGENWSLVRHVRDGSVMALVARSSVDLWVVGATINGQVFLDHWDGSAWKSITSPEASPPTIDELLPTATLAADGAVLAFTADYPDGLGGHDPNPNDVPNNYIWASCS